MDEEKQDEIRILSKFMITGLSGVFVNYISIFILLFFLTEPIAIGVAIFISMSTNYIINRVWTFSSDGPILREYLKYLASASLGSIIQFLITIYLTRFIRNSWRVYDITLYFLSIDILYLGVLVGIGVGFVANYIISRLFVFN